MGNISSKINLGALICQIKNVEGKGGKPVKCIIIPIEANHLFEGKNDAVYLDTIGFPLANSTGKDTHLIKQSLPKDVQDKMSDADKRAMPILGNHIDWDNGSSSAPAPKTKAASTSKSKDDEPPF